MLCNTEGQRQNKLVTINWQNIIISQHMLCNTYL